MPQSFIKMMRRQKNSLPMEKEKNTDGKIKQICRMG